MIKKLKIASVWIDPEKEITSKKDGQKYKLCPVNLKVSDESKEYTGKYIKGAIFEYKDRKDASKNKTAQQKADEFKLASEGKDIVIDVTESQSTGKDGKVYDNLNFKTPSKKELEVAKQFLK